MLLAPRAGRRSGRGPPSGDTMCGPETRGVGTGHERLARRRPQQLAREQISWRPPGTVPCTLIAHGQRQIQRLLRTPLLLRLRGMCLRLDYPCHSSLTATGSAAHTPLLPGSNPNLKTSKYRIVGNFSETTYELRLTCVPLYVKSVTLRNFANFIRT